jgi:hypothetical protein
MEYRLLTKGHERQIWRNKLLDLETAHMRLGLDARLAEMAGAHTEDLGQIWADIAFLTRQIEILADWMTPPEPDPETPSANGQREEEEADA